MFISNPFSANILFIWYCKLPVPNVDELDVKLEYVVYGVELLIWSLTDILVLGPLSCMF